MAETGAETANKTEGELEKAAVVSFENEGKGFKWLASVLSGPYVAEP